MTNTNASHADANALADSINAAYAEGKTVTVNGRKVKAPHWTNRPAQVWQNGTLEVNVVPRSRGARSGYTYAKQGQNVHIEIA